VTTDLAPLGAPLRERSFDDLLAEAVRFHGHLCPGQVLGVRMALAGCRAVGLEEPRRAGKGLVVFVEIDRCATDAIQVLTGVSLGKRTLKHTARSRSEAAPRPSGRHPPDQRWRMAS
jgi:formylmethanofuran dehydrogenase subunit E